MPDIELSGLDGSNLLAYLAALGTLRVVTLASPGVSVRMSWREKSWWTPVIHHPEVRDSDSLIELLAARVCGPQAANPAWSIGKDLTFNRTEFARLLEASVRESRPDDRVQADFLCSFGSDAFGNGPKQQILDTEFRTMSGAGHQHFLGFMQELAQVTDAGHLRRALFAAWDYADPRPSLRWDPADYRPHALRAQDPSGDPIRTMRGANRLAVEALPLFPTAPGTRSLFTAGFAEADGMAEITWPVWLDPVIVDTVRSLLLLAEVYQADREFMKHRGIAQSFRSQRFTEGKYRNFTPARPLL